MGTVRKIVTGICILLIPVLLITGCNKNASDGSSEALVVSKANNSPKGTAFFNFFDTVSYVYSYAGDNDETFDKIASEVADILEKYHRLFDIYYEYTDTNNLCTVNRNAGGKPVIVDRELIDFLLYAKKACELTKGEMDITMGSVLSLWHDARSAEQHYVPSYYSLKEALEHSGFDKLEIDEKNSTVRLTDSKASLDVGALGKGYATEKAAEYLKERGLSAYVLNIGGNVRIIGTKTDKSGWVTGIRNPQDPDGPFSIKINISDCSCVTSGVYERYFTVDGKKYHHIIDKDTLYPAQYFDSLTVICKDSGLADTLSTALFCMPFEEGKNLVDSLEGVDCIWITKDGTVTYTDGVKDMIVNN